LLQRNPDTAEDEHLERLAQRLVRRDEWVGVDDVEGTLREAVRMFKVIREREEVSTSRTGDRFFEVPFSFRGSGEGTILRGTVDCLAKAAEGKLTVFEVKTGRPSADHQAQLDAYVAAIRALFPEAAVEGRLIYS
jgi:RecB family exonuclease